MTGVQSCVKVDIHIHILLSFLLLCYGGIANFHCSRVHNESIQDLHSLLHFKQGVTSDPNGALSNWYTSSHFCQWNGVICTSRSPLGVIELYLSNQNLSGQISSSLDNLTFLEDLDLSKNNFIGPFPLRGCLQHLQFLYLYENNMSGTIPDALTNYSSLSILYLTSNSLVGSITPKLGLLSNLECLRLDSNQLELRIPNELGKLVNLEVFDLSHNRFSGEIPQTIFSVSYLLALWLGGNILSGQTPRGIGNLTLTDLNLSENNFRGAIEGLFDNLTQLEYLRLHGSELEGPIPASLGNLLNTRQLYLDNNNFQGSMP
ncbi:receptor-like protein 33 [Panicum virgatum]|uniref:Leucine-rich repeat-containing N-terminal plant-type domain-containing protein n=1 Tax=Panicum virgatum TaxID=38727 RepID=A0A8T0VXK6_PANVG|nr:receptor-like protein 33 [Panicum virgatum]KAG2641651.1 hypothetical protein PVAP13_2KG210200 [Panicum virgatum]